MKLRKVNSVRRPLGLSDTTVVPTDDWLALLRVLRAAAKVNETHTEHVAPVEEQTAALDSLARALEAFEREEK